MWTQYNYGCYIRPVPLIVWTELYWEKVPYISRVYCPSHHTGINMTIQVIILKQSNRNYDHSSSVATYMYLLGPSRSFRKRDIARITSLNMISARQEVKLA